MARGFPAWPNPSLSSRAVYKSGRHFIDTTHSSIPLRTLNKMADNSDKPRQIQAEAKRQSIYNAFPSKWSLKEDNLPPPDQRRNRLLVYSFPLTPQEIEITETDAVDLVSYHHRDVERGAVEVAEAFCHREAIVRQLVGTSANVFLRPDWWINVSRVE